MTGQPLLESYLKELRLPAFLKHYRPFAEDAAQANQSYDRYLLALAEQEVSHRERNRLQRLVREAHFPVLKELADFDFSCVPSLSAQRVLELAQGQYIRQAEPVLLVGNPGLGKSHIATGLALAACRQGHRVRFYTAAALVNELIQAQEERRLPKVLAGALKQQVVVLDELGFIPFTTTGAQLIFQFCATLYERVALLVTTNLRFADWTQVFGDERLTAALLDRLTHKAHILEFSGAESYRFRTRLQREARQPQVTALSCAAAQDSAVQGSTVQD
jgi:DNA replication protein DnaC